MPLAADIRNNTLRLSASGGEVKHFPSHAVSHYPLGVITESSRYTGVPFFFLMRKSPSYIGVLNAPSILTPLSSRIASGHTIYVYNIFLVVCTMRYRCWLRHYATSRMVTNANLDGGHCIFQLTLSAALGSTQPERETSTISVGVNGGRRVRLTISPSNCEPVSPVS
jgi:hypothetical protein